MYLLLPCKPRMTVEGRAVVPFAPDGALERKYKRVYALGFKDPNRFENTLSGLSGLELSVLMGISAWALFESSAR